VPPCAPLSVCPSHLVEHLGQHRQNGLQVSAWGDELQRHKVLQGNTHHTPHTHGFET